MNEGGCTSEEGCVNEEGCSMSEEGCVFANSWIEEDGERVVGVVDGGDGENREVAGSNGLKLEFGPNSKVLRPVNSCSRA